MAVRVIVVLFSIILEVTGQRDTARSMGTPNPWYMPASREAPVPAAYLRKLAPFLVAHRMRPVGTQRRARTLDVSLFFHTKLRFYTTMHSLACTLVCSGHSMPRTSRCFLARHHALQTLHPNAPP